MINCFIDLVYVALRGEGWWQVGITFQQSITSLGGVRGSFSCGRPPGRRGLGPVWAGVAVSGELLGKRGLCPAWAWVAVSEKILGIRGPDLAWAGVVVSEKILGKRGPGPAWAWVSVSEKLLGRRGRDPVGAWEEARAAILALAQVRSWARAACAPSRRAWTWALACT